ncbi:MAG: DUF5685 family protein [Oscillospiraceae bacterium]|jgi:hypothetical protein|nr:DUF5685 family protein [Oscillospiraceae bacterium]
MYGYIRPYKPELKIREWETYKGVYCALCETLKSSYGFAARFAVNYDFTFLTMLLAKPGQEIRNTVCRCPADLRKKPHCFVDGVRETAAGLSVIMGYYKLKDSLTDDGFAKKMFVTRPSLTVISGKFRKSRTIHEKFSETAKKRLDELTVLEHNKENSAFRCADKFAEILSAIGEYSDDDYNRRVLAHLLYQIGYMIYLLDACDDIDEDTKRGNYNPLINSAELASIRETLETLARTAAADFELLDPNPFHGILENIFYLGLQNTIDNVLKKVEKTDSTELNRTGNNK